MGFRALCIQPQRKRTKKKQDKFEEEEKSVKVHVTPPSAAANHRVPMSQKAHPPKQRCRQMSGVGLCLGGLLSELANHPPALHEHEIFANNLFTSQREKKSQHNPPRRHANPHGDQQFRSAAQSSPLGRKLE